jgi:hypothetical protein
MASGDLDGSHIKAQTQRAQTAQSTLTILTDSAVANGRHDDDARLARRRFAA